MRLVKLTHRTRKGEQRIMAYGVVWHVLREAESIPAHPGVPGPWLYIDNCAKDKDANHQRWVHKHNDPDFYVKEV